MVRRSDTDSVGRLADFRLRRVGVPWGVASSGRSTGPSGRTPLAFPKVGGVICASTHAVLRPARSDRRRRTSLSIATADRQSTPRIPTRRRTRNLGEMISILVVCGGNQCRSPIAEAFLRSRLHERLGSAAPTVASAGTIARTGAPATPETVMVAREHGLVASTHEAAAIRPEMLTAADVVLTMTADQRDTVRTMSARAATKTFTLKEAVGLLEQLPAVHQPPEPDQVRLRLAEADACRRRRGIAPVDDEDVIDPIGQPMQTHRAVAWELAELCDRLVDGLFGSAEETTESAGKAS